MRCHLIGLNHAHQLEGYEHGAFKTFSQFLTSFCINANIDFLAEELSEEAIALWGAEGSVAKTVAKQLSIEHLFCDPQVGAEMRDVHPFLVLSPRIFNEKTTLVIGLPMTTAKYNADNPFAVAVGQPSGRKVGKTSYVLCHQPKSFDWRLRNAKAHQLKRLQDALFVQVCERVNQIIKVA